MTRVETSITERLRYDSETGVLWWKAGNFAGRPAGATQTGGYLQVSVDGRRMLAHRIAWFLFYGTWPSETIDHINGNTSDNRIANLRDLPRRGNQQNVTKRKDNTSGFLGVSAFRGKWKAQINHRGRKVYLGIYDDPEDAAASYELAKFALHEYQPTERGKCHVP